MQSVCVHFFHCSQQYVSCLHRTCYTDSSERTPRHGDRGQKRYDFNSRKLECCVTYKQKQNDLEISQTHILSTIEQRKHIECLN